MLLDHHGNPMQRSVSNWGSDSFTFNGNTYPINASGGRGMLPTMAAGRPTLGGNLDQVAEAVQGHSVITGAVLARTLLVRQLTFQWRDIHTDDLFDRRAHPSLSPVQKRRAGARSLSRVLAQAESNVSFAGNAYIYISRTTGNLRTLQPDHVQLVLGTNASEAAVTEAIESSSSLPEEYRQEALQYALDSEVIAYIYHPPGLPPELIEVGDIAHWAPEPHPTNPWIGASWITSVFQEFKAFMQADRYADLFFQQGATPRLVYKMDPTLTPDEVEEFKLISEAQSAGVLNSHRSMYLGGAADVQVVGSNVGDIDLKKIHGQLESRMAMRSRVPAVILGISEGMQGSSLNSGNYGQTRRMWADGWFTPTANGLAEAIETILTRPPKDAYLSWDPAKVLFLQEDQKDAAEIFALQAQTIRSLTDGGYKPETVTAAADKFNPKLLKHSGLLPVQVQAPGSGEADVGKSPAQQVADVKDVKKDLANSKKEKPTA